MTTGLLTTTVGRNAIIADLGGGADLVLTHVAWGDANGVPYNPNEGQVALVNEKYRATIASVAVVGGAIVVDAVIPADTNDGTGRPSHGFSVAEVGLFSSTGTLIGLARCGNGYKPPPSSGQAHDVTYRLKLAVANPSAITVVIDPVAQVNVGRHVRPFWITVDGILNDPPAAPVLGATYVIGAAPTGAWIGFAHRIAQWVGVWALATVPVGHVVCDNSKAEDLDTRFMRRSAAGWVSAIATATAYGVTRMATAAEAKAKLSGTTALSPLTVAAATSVVGRTIVYNTPGTFTFTVPDNVTEVEVEGWGGGGAGGATGNGSGGGLVGNLGGGGGGGGYFYRRLTGLVPGQTVTVTIGSGGVPAAGPSSGGVGGTTSFGPFCTAAGGAGGGWGENTLIQVGTGGAATGGDINVAGGTGGLTGSNSATATPSDSVRGYGRGGNTAQAYGFVDLGVTGAAGRGFGTGGSGSSGGSNLPGGAGAPGLLIVRW